MNADWPKTVRVGGREFEVHPDMSFREFTELAQILHTEVEKLTELHEAMGYDLDLDLEDGRGDGGSWGYDR